MKLKELIERNKRIDENILDYPRKNLSSDVFIKEKIRPDIKKELMSVFNKWKEKNWPDLDIKNWYLLGSITTYQYNDSSDIDVNIITSSNNRDKISKLWKLLPNGNKLKGHPVNYYISPDLKDVNKSKTLYDLENETWIRKPSVNDISAPTSYSLEIAKFFMDAIDLRLSELERDKKELRTFKDLLSSNSSMTSEEEIKDEISRLKSEIKADIDSIRLAHYIIKSFRKEGFEDKENKFKFSINVSDGDSNKSFNNLIYKELEKYDYFKKIEKAEEYKIKD